MTIANMLKFRYIRAKKLNPKMKKCMACGRFNVKNPKHDKCYDCFIKGEDEDSSIAVEGHFENNLDFNEIHTVYIMLYGNKNKIGYTKDLDSRIFEIKRMYPNNELVYFREFLNESQARRFEVWLGNLPGRDLNKFITTFQNKVNKLKLK